jgi:diguanylate cyclase (GGDEF)-like protein
MKPTQAPITPAADGTASARGVGASPLRVLAVHAALLGLWLAGFLAARWLEYAPHASLWFPPAAVTFGAILVLGIRAVPTLWLACIAATMLTDIAYGSELPPGQLLASNLSFALVHTLAYGLVAWPLRELVRRRPRASRSLRALVAFLLGGAVAAGLAAVGGAFGLSMSGMIPPAELAAIIVPWWIGDYAGLVALAPLVVLLLAQMSDWAGFASAAGMPRFAGPATRDRQVYFVFKLLLLLGYSALVLGAAAGLPQQEALIFALFVSVVIQLWIVHTEGETQSLVAIAAFSLLLAAGAAALGLGHHALTLQFAMICLAANSHFGLVVPRLYADNHRLRQLLTHDPLTGALSRAFFEDRARVDIHAAQQRQQPSALLMIDLDDLKLINDRHGHAAGDRALRALADACAAALRPGDALGRLSGDEFGAVLPGAERRTAEAVIAAMREALQAASGKLAFPLQASIGAGVVEHADDDFESVLARADGEMYRDKQGRMGDQRWGEVA